MRNFALILAIVAVGYAGYRFHVEHPDVLGQAFGRGSKTAIAQRSSATNDLAFGSGAVQTISTGSRVDVTAHVAPTGRTIIEFTAHW